VPIVKQSMSLLATRLQAEAFTLPSVRRLVKWYSTCKITELDDNIKMDIKTSRLGWRGLDSSGWGYAGLLSGIRRVKLPNWTIILKSILKQVVWGGVA